MDWSKIDSVKWRGDERDDNWITKVIGCGTHKFAVPALMPGEPHQLLKVTPTWFACKTNVRIGKVMFTSGAKATVSVFVCPVGFTPSSWHTMLTTSNWDTMNGWLMDRCSVETAGTHETYPCSTKDAYQLGPDDSVHVVTHGKCGITDVSIVLELPTYEAISSDVMSLSDHLPRAPPSQVSFEWSEKHAQERYIVERAKIIKWLDKAPNSDINRVLNMISDSDEDEEKDNLTDCD